LGWWVTLGTREAALGPAVRVAVRAQQGVLLLNAEPHTLLLGRLHHFVTADAVVALWAKTTTTTHKQHVFWGMLLFLICLPFAI